MRYVARFQQQSLNMNRMFAINSLNITIWRSDWIDAWPYIEKLESPGLIAW